MKQHSTTNIQRRTLNKWRVARASGLWFWASRPKPSREECGDFSIYRLLAIESASTKSGATPDLTGVTPVPPTAWDVECFPFCIYGI